MENEQKIHEEIPNIKTIEQFEEYIAKIRMDAYKEGYRDGYYQGTISTNNTFSL